MSAEDLAWGLVLLLAFVAIETILLCRPARRGSSFPDARPRSGALRETDHVR